MAEHCCCGNKLRDCRVTIRISPCACAEPGPGSRTLEGLVLIPTGVTRSQYNERKRLAMPLLTPLEEGMFRGMKRWH